YRSKAPVHPNEWSIRACHCGFCRVHVALPTSDRSGVRAVFRWSSVFHILGVLWPWSNRKNFDSAEEL
ncbi:MAG: hypothetical protein ACREP8_01435, partial [Candidatus Binatia bacterium]